MFAVAVLLFVVVTVAVVYLVLTFAARRAGYSGVGGETIVRCSKGHLFTTIWAPGVSFKSVRLGMTRYQHCPVGHHWAVVTPLKETELTEEDRRLAAEHHDLRIP
jgi:hypothetical protein